MTDYPHFKNGLTIENRAGVWCVCNNGYVRHECDGLDDAIDIRDRAAFGAPDEAVQLQAKIDANNNRSHAAKVAIEALTDDGAFRVVGGRSDLIVYRAYVDCQPVFGEAYTDETPTDAVALERLLLNVELARSGSPELQMVAAE